MEVLVGSTLGIEVSSASAFVRERAAAVAAAQVGDDSKTSFGAGRLAKSEEEEEEEDDSSSSIGAPDDSDEEEGEEEEDGVVSAEDAKGGLKKGGFGSFRSLASLEDSLPIKRGLSNHFSGKSKSFNNLSEANLTEVVNSAKDLEKPEHPFNKKRRILRWSKNYPLLSTAKSMPLFPLSEEDDDDDADAAPNRREADDDDDYHPDGDGERGKTVAASRFSGRLVRKHSVFKSSSCFALSDLHEEDEEDDDDAEDEGN